MTEGYHYTGCGLDYVYLQNGFTVHDTSHGRGVSIDNADGLHAAIARSIVVSPARMRGQEVRFLRSLLDLSQTCLARALGTTRASVARWEGAPHGRIPPQPDHAMRMFYALYAAGHEIAQQLRERLNEIDERENGETVFFEGDGGWQRRAA